MTTIEALQAKFEDLFDSKESAVVCYLSLERRYIALSKKLERLKRPKCNVCGGYLDECRVGHKQY